MWAQSLTCVRMLHLVPRWQSSDRHVKLKTIMQDRPDLIESELSGLAFDSNQQVFKSSHIDIMFTQPTPEPILNEAVYNDSTSSSTLQLAGHIATTPFSASLAIRACSR